MDPLSRTVALVVEPQLLADMIEHVLTRAGFRVVAANGGPVDVTISSSPDRSTIVARPLIRLVQHRPGTLIGVVKVGQADELVRLDSPWDLIHLTRRLSGG